MTPALRWAAMRAILMFHNCEGQNDKTVSTDHNCWRERRAEADLNRSPSAYQPNALLLGQTGSQGEIQHAVKVKYGLSTCQVHLKYVLSTCQYTWMADRWLGLVAQSQSCCLLCGILPSSACVTSRCLPPSLPPPTHTQLSTVCCFLPLSDNFSSSFVSSLFSCPLPPSCPLQTHACTHECARAHTPEHIPTHACSAHTHTHTGTLTHSHTHTHTHTLNMPSSPYHYLAEKFWPACSLFTVEAWYVVHMQLEIGFICIVCQLLCAVKRGKRTEAPLE